LLKDIKSEICTNFIYPGNREIIIIINKVIFTSDMNTIEKYMKNLNNMDSNEVMSLRLLQSKLYLKILDISYFIKDTNLPITVDVIKIVIENTHIFKDTILVSHPHI